VLPVQTLRPVRDCQTAARILKYLNHSPSPHNRDVLYLLTYYKWLKVPLLNSQRSNSSNPRWNLFESVATGAIPQGKYLTGQAQCKGIQGKRIGGLIQLPMVERL
jgi:hypothetical protein